MNIFSRLFSWYLTRSALPYWCVLFLDYLIIIFSGYLAYYLFNGGAQVTSLQQFRGPRPLDPCHVVRLHNRICRLQNYPIPEQYLPTPDPPTDTSLAVLHIINVRCPYYCEDDVRPLPH